MTIREQIISEVQKIPEQYLPELHKIIKGFEEQKVKPSLMQQLREIKIQAPPDFAENLDLYMSGEKEIG
jgi:hypothetical protein